MTERMTSAELKAALAQGKEPALKFGNEPIEVEGIRFDSRREAKRWLALRWMEKAGQITDLRRQVPIMLEGRDGPVQTETGRQMRLTVDFAYVDVKTGLTIFEDAKGMATRDYLVRKAVAAAQGVEVKET